MTNPVLRHTAVMRGLLGLAVLSIVAACSGGAATPSPTAVAPGPTPTPVPTTTVTSPPNAEQITFWSWVPDINKQVDAFNGSQSAIFVNYVNNGNGNTEYAKLLTALQAGTGIPDVVQIEYQHLPSFIVRGQLANLANYGAADAKSKFVPWTWSQVSQGSGVYGYPQDAGPMIMMCNKAVLSKFGISAVPATWDEFAADAAKIHKADAKSYISNFTDDQGWYFGMLWQAGAKPFVVNGAQISINFTSPEALKVAKFWGDLLKSGSLSPVATWSNDWNSALDKSTIACWEAGAWGTSAITQGAPSTKGTWTISTLPQWTAGGKSDGAYGGSSIAVTNASQHQKAADAFAAWLTTDAKATLALTGGNAQLFPVQVAALADPTWTGGTDPFFSGQALHTIMADAMSQVDPSFGWSPFTSYVYNIYATDLVQVHSGKMTFEALMNDLQAKSVQYAKDQGMTVK
jgi:multiple sugar transport system substrate-binding protein